MKFSKVLWVLMAVVAFSACKDDGTNTPEKKDDTVPIEKEPAPIEVKEANMSLINKMTATWCGPCGQWGWTLFQEIIDATEKDAVIMGTYGSSTSNYFNITADAFKKSQAASAGWPAFCTNGSNRTEYSSTGGIYTTTTRQNVITEVGRHKSGEVIAAAGYHDTMIDGKIQLKVKTKFFKDGSAGSDYYVGAYVMEDGVVGYQNGQGASAKHHHVLRSSFTNEAWGVKIDNGTSTGSEFETIFEMDADPSWKKENLEYAVVIWRNLGPKYLFVNAYQEKD